MDARDELALRAAKLYYESSLSQAEVATELGLSRPTVAKLLQHAKDRGYVLIQVIDPREESGALRSEMLRRFAGTGLCDVRVVQAARESERDVLRALGRMGALILEEHVQDCNLVGVSWGKTMYAVAKNLSHSPRRGVEVVQLKGGLSYTEASSNDIETINFFCRAFDAYARTLPLPVIFDNPEVKKVVERDRHIAQILEHGRTADVAVFTVGGVQRDSLPLTMGYLSEEEIHLLEKNAVGDACSRYFTADGEVAVPSVDERTVGIALDDLRKLPVRILVAGGVTKAEAITAALRMGLATHLVIDQATASHIVGSAG